MAKVDYYELPRRQLQALCKKHGIPANGTNLSMADALKNMEEREEKHLNPVKKQQLGDEDTKEAVAGSKSDISSEISKNMTEVDQETVVQISSIAISVDKILEKASTEKAPRRNGRKVHFRDQLIQVDEHEQLLASEEKVKDVGLQSHISDIGKPIANKEAETISNEAQKSRQSKVRGRALSKSGSKKVSSSESAGLQEDTSKEAELPTSDKLTENPEDHEREEKTNTREECCDSPEAEPAEMQKGRGRNRRGRVATSESVVGPSKGKSNAHDETVMKEGIDNGLNLNLADDMSAQDESNVDQVERGSKKFHRRLNDQDSHEGDMEVEDRFISHKEISETQELKEILIIEAKDKVEEARILVLALNPDPQTDKKPVLVELEENRGRKGGRRNLTKRGCKSQPKTEAKTEMVLSKENVDPVADCAVFLRVTPNKKSENISGVLNDVQEKSVMEAEKEMMSSVLRKDHLDSLVKEQPEIIRESVNSASDSPPPEGARSDLAGLEKELICHKKLRERSGKGRIRLSEPDLVTQSSIICDVEAKGKVRSKLKSFESKELTEDNGSSLCETELQAHEALPLLYAPDSHYSMQTKASQPENQKSQREGRRLVPSTQGASALADEEKAEIAAKQAFIAVKVSRLHKSAEAEHLKPVNEQPAKNLRSRGCVHTKGNHPEGKAKFESDGLSWKENAIVQDMKEQIGIEERLGPYEATMPEVDRNKDEIKCRTACGKFETKTEMDSAKTKKHQRFFDNQIKLENNWKLVSANLTDKSDAAEETAEKSINPDNLTTSSLEVESVSSVCMADTDRDKSLTKAHVRKSRRLSAAYQIVGNIPSESRISTRSNKSSVIHEKLVSIAESSMYKESDAAESYVISSLIMVPESSTQDPEFSFSETTESSHLDIEIPVNHQMGKQLVSSSVKGGEYTPSSSIKRPARTRKQKNQSFEESVKVSTRTTKKDEKGKKAESIIKLDWILNREASNFVQEKVSCRSSDDKRNSTPLQSSTHTSSDELDSFMRDGKSISLKGAPSDCHVFPHESQSGVLNEKSDTIFLGISACGTELPKNESVDTISLDNSHADCAALLDEEEPSISVVHIPLAADEAVQNNQSLCDGTLGNILEGSIDSERLPRKAITHQASLQEFIILEPAKFEHSATPASSLKLHFIDPSKPVAGYFFHKVSSLGEEQMTKSIKNASLMEKETCDSYGMLDKTDVSYLTDVKQENFQLHSETYSGTTPTRMARASEKIIRSPKNEKECIDNNFQQHNVSFMSPASINLSEVEMESTDLGAFHQVGKLLYETQVFENHLSEELMSSISHPNQQVVLANRSPDQKLLNIELIASEYEALPASLQEVQEHKLGENARQISQAYGTRSEATYTTGETGVAIGSVKSKNKLCISTSGGRMDSARKIATWQPEGTPSQESREVKECGSASMDNSLIEKMQLFNEGDELPKQEINAIRVSFLSEELENVHFCVDETEDSSSRKSHFLPQQDMQETNAEVVAMSLACDVVVGSRLDDNLSANVVSPKFHPSEDGKNQPLPSEHIRSSVDCIMATVGSIMAVEDKTERSIQLKRLALEKAENSIDAAVSTLAERFQLAGIGLGSPQTDSCTVAENFMGVSSQPQGIADIKLKSPTEKEIGATVANEMKSPTEKGTTVVNERSGEKTVVKRCAEIISEVVTQKADQESVNSNCTQISFADLKSCADPPSPVVLSNDGILFKLEINSDKTMVLRVPLSEDESLLSDPNESTQTEEKVCENAERDIPGCGVEDPLGLDSDSDDGFDVLVSPDVSEKAAHMLSVDPTSTSAEVEVSVKADSYFGTLLTPRIELNAEVNVLKEESKAQLICITDSMSCKAAEETIVSIKPTKDFFKNELKQDHLQAHEFHKKEITVDITEGKDAMSYKALSNVNKETMNVSPCVLSKQEESMPTINKVMGVCSAEPAYGSEMNELNQKHLQANEFHGKENNDLAKLSLRKLRALCKEKVQKRKVSDGKETVKEEQHRAVLNPVTVNIIGGSSSSSYYDRRK